MENLMKEQLIQLISDFVLHKDTLQNRRFPKFSLKTEELSTTKFSVPLSDFLYRHYYCGMPEEPAKVASDQSTKSEFVNQLKAAVQEEGFRLDRGWQILEKDRQGGIYVAKGFRKNFFQPGQFLLQSTMRGFQPGSLTQKAITNYSYEPSSYFFYIHGARVDEYTRNFLVRFYLNARAEGAPLLLEQLHRMLNIHQLPFEMKCPADPTTFDRRDSLVLYLNRRYTNYFLAILATVYPQIQKYLESEIPLFTKAIYPGIGFAESPPKNETSFGMSRCDLLAQSIYDCIQQGTPIANWGDAVCSALQANGFTIETFYLNPFSQYPYDFTYSKV